MDAIIETLKTADNEATRSPYWLIIDPKQMMSPDCHYVASMISGPFFCRKDAQEFLDKTHYNFSHRAVVYCHSGHMSQKYDDLCRSVEKI